MAEPILLDADGDANWIATLERKAGRLPPAPPSESFTAMVDRRMAEMAYDPNQPRRPDGKWGTKGVFKSTPPAGQLAVPDDMGDFNEIGQQAIIDRANSTADAIAKAGYGQYPRTPEEMAAHLDTVYDRATPEQRAAGMVWYQKAHDTLAAEAAKYPPMTPDQAYAITAVLSPGRIWDGNEAMAKAIIRIHGEDQPFTPVPGVTLFKGNELPPGPDGKPKATYRPSELTGTQLSLVHPAFKGVSGSRNQSVQIERAFRIARGAPIDGTTVIDGKAVATVGGTKVRNFYNNIRSPDDTTSVTIDTWQVRAHLDAAGVTRVPKGAVGKDGTVKAWVNVNPSGKRGDPSVAIDWATGSPTSVKGGVGDGVGMYPMFASAVKIAAKKRGISPQQMQAIVWTVYRDEHGD